MTFGLLSVPFTALQNCTGDLPTVQQLTQYMSKPLCNFCLAIHPCNTSVLPHGCIISLTRHCNSRCECVHLFPSLFHWLFQRKTPRCFRRKTFFSRSHFDSSPDTTFHPMSNSSSSSVKYFSILLLVWMPHFMNSSYMSSRMKNATRKVDCVSPPTIHVMPEICSKKMAHHAWQKQHFIH